MSTTTILKEIYFQTLSVGLRSDGLMEVKINANVEIDVNNVLEIVGAIKKIGEEKKYPILLIFGEYTLPTLEARNYVATAESNPYAIAEAYVIQSFTQKITGNIYLKINKPIRPTRLFNSEEDAVDWLKTFL